MHLELSFHPTIQTIGVVRRTIMTLCEPTIDRDASSRVALATHELLENVLRHSLDGDTILTVRAYEGPHARITVTTYSRATPAKIAELKAFTAQMAQSKPDEFYLAVMMSRANTEDDGGLGLARVYAEAEMSLDVQSDGDTVKVIASTARLGEAA
jgi:hypothetical protein